MAVLASAARNVSKLVGTGPSCLRAFSASSSAAQDAVKFDFAVPFEYHNLEEGSIPMSTEVTKDELLAIFKQMARIRRMEMVADTLYKSKEIRGFCHLYDGQEGIAVGMESILERDDAVITAYRSHGWQITRGGSIEGLLGELCGRQIGCSKGKGGSMHTYHDNFYGGNGIVGAQVPLGAGVAFAMKYGNKDRVCVSLYGDGAANQGQIFEAYNMAKLWKLPAIFVCENNLWGMGTSIERAAASTDFFKRGDFLPGIKADGMDVLAMREATRFARDFALREGPIVIEAITYRYHGHSMSDPGTTYRTRDDVQKVRTTRDSIDLVKRRLVDAGFATEKEIKSMEKEIKAEVDAAKKAALESPQPNEDQLFLDVVANNDEVLAGTEGLRNGFVPA